MKSILMVFLSAFFSVGCLCAQTVDSLAKTQQEKVDDALRRLNEQREAIKNAQIPLVKNLNEWEAKAKTLRVTVEKKQGVRDSKSVSLEKLQSNIAAQSKEYDYITRTLFAEYIANYEASLSAGEQAEFNPSIRDLNRLLDNLEASETEQLQQSLKLIEESLDRLNSLIGGKRYAGQALNGEGQLITGKFIQTGPLLYFAGPDNAQTGLIEESKTLQPRIQTLDETLAKEIRTFAEQGRGQLPLDPSLGNALALEQTQDSLREHLRKGGIWVYPIVLFALLSTLAALVKCLQIFTLRHPAPLVVHDIVKLVRDGQRKEARDLAKEQPEPASTMLVNAVEHADESVELVEEVMYESMLNTQPKLERFLNIIAVTAAIAPLLGLLGTVTGIIKTFKLMNVFGAGDPKPLISGISEALITTELGLVLAIPSLIIYALLSRKVAGAMAHLEKLSVAFVNGLSRRSCSS